MENKRIKQFLSAFLFFLSLNAFAQDENYRLQYQNMVRAYNQDLKAASRFSALREEAEKSAKADLLPKLSASADVRYMGNPLQLTVDMPSFSSPVSFQGRDVKYGTTLTLAQPVYAGGALRAAYAKARQEREMAYYEKKRIENNLAYDADVYYWNSVAQAEMVKVAEEFRTSVALLVDIVRQRVTAEYTDRNELLMAEVRLNDADYQLLQARNDCELARLSLNSYAGVPFEEVIPVDSLVCPLTDPADYSQAMASSLMARPEVNIASRQVAAQQSAAKIANAQFLPKFSVGIDGSYTSPGYDFGADLDPNYIVYAKVSVPLFEWGKRKHTHRMGAYQVDIARENEHKIADQVRLEVEKAYHAYTEAVRRVNLTENSLLKASENERLALDKYRAGSVSMLEVINAQIYHQEARVNYIQSKLNAQIARSSLDRATGNGAES